MRRTLTQLIQNPIRIMFQQLQLSTFKCIDYKDGGMLIGADAGRNITDNAEKCKSGIIYKYACVRVKHTTI